jgi:hypothetical protein
MSAATGESKVFKRGEVVVAIIGLVGVLTTGILSNLDKLFPKQNVVQATYSGYRPTGNFETELRYYFDVSGTRKALEATQQHMLSNLRTQAITANPSDAAEITKIWSIIDKEAIKLDDVIREILPSYQKHFSLAEMQELNKFYSTELMQGMIKKLPLLAQDLAPIQTQMLQDYMERLQARIREEIKSK